MVKTSTVYLGGFAVLFTFFGPLLINIGFITPGVVLFFVAIVLWTVFAEEIRIQKRDEALASCNKELSKYKKR
jgi:hypothetical protein